MHPTLFRIPLPHVPIKYWWGLVAVAAIALLFTGLSLKQKDKAGAVVSTLVAALLFAAAYYFRTSVLEAPNLPIYAYGVMLGLSLVVGWFLSIPLAEKDGLPRETMANCYVVTCISALLGARLLYVVTNPGDFTSLADLLALRSGGLVAYGGFLGGLLGAWVFLAPKRLKFIAWGDTIVPSVATGLLITRIGCYLFGCDFGVRLGEGAPSFLKRLGTFPHWPAGTIAAGDGSPAFTRHLELYKGTPLEAELMKSNVSFPVHPTQLYEALIGLLLFALLMYVRKRIKFRGQVFFVFLFTYGTLRFLIELIRDDDSRGAYGPVLDEHIYVPGALLLLAVAFIFGVSLSIPNKTVRIVSRILGFAPAVIAYFVLAPASFAKTVPYQLSESQIIGLVSALLVSYFFAKHWDEAGRHPDAEMRVGDPAAIAALIAESEGEAPPPQEDKKPA